MDLSEFFYVGGALPEIPVITFWERSKSYLTQKKNPEFWKHTLMEVCALRVHSSFYYFTKLFIFNFV